MYSWLPYNGCPSCAAAPAGRLTAGLAAISQGSVEACAGQAFRNSFTHAFLDLRSCRPELDVPTSVFSLRSTRGQSNACVADVCDMVLWQNQPRTVEDAQVRPGSAACSDEKLALPWSMGSHEHMQCTDNALPQMRLRDRIQIAFTRRAGAEMSA